MKTIRTILRNIAVIPAAAFMILPAILANASEERLDWRTTDSEVANRLPTGERKIHNLPSNPKQIVEDNGIEKERDHLALAALQELEKRVENDHRPVDLADAAAMLTANVGGEWMMAKRERVPALGQDLWCSFSSWHGVHVPYVVLPFPSSDEGGRAKLDAFSRKCSAALEVIASDDRWTLVAGPSHEPDVTGNVLKVLGMKMSKDAEVRRRTYARAEWLDFRLAVAADTNPPSAAQIADYRDLFARKGPNGGRHRGDPYLWFSKLDICGAPTTVVRTRDEYGVEYLLLGNKPEDVLISGSAHPRPWYLKRVHASKDAHGRTSITLELDETSARRMRELIGIKKGRPLAVLFHNRILAIQAINEGLGDRIVLSGDEKGFDENLAGKIVRSLSECMLPET